MPVHSFKNHTPQLGQESFIAPGAHVIGNVSVGKRSSVWFNAVLRGDLDRIVIGVESNLQDNVTIHVDQNSPTIVGSRVTVGHNAVLHGCTIEDGVLIGMNAVLLNGVVVGRDSIIAAGSLLTPGTVVPPRSLVMGSPGKVVRELSEDQIPLTDGMYKRYLELARLYSEDA